MPVQIQTKKNKNECDLIVSWLEKIVWWTQQDVFEQQHVSFNLLQISVLKAKLNESLGMPAGKQKLQYEVCSLVLYFFLCWFTLFVELLLYHLIVLVFPLLK